MRAIIQNISSIDKKAALAVHSWSGNSFLNRFMKAVSFSASEYAYPAYGLLVLFIAPPWYKAALFTMCCGFLIEVTIQKLMKNNIKRPRPCDAVAEIEALDYIPDRYSFPSGHAAGAFNVAITGTLFAGPWAALLFIWAILASLSRVYNGVHYPGDVLFGAFLGSAATFAGYGLSFYIF